MYLFVNDGLVGLGGDVHVLGDARPLFGSDPLVGQLVAGLILDQQLVETDNDVRASVGRDRVRLGDRFDRDAVDDVEVPRIDLAGLGERPCKLSVGESLIGEDVLIAERGSTPDCVTSTNPVMIDSASAVADASTLFSWLTGPSS